MSDFVRIPLYGKGGVIRDWVTASAADAEWLGCWRWHKDAQGYAARTGRASEDGHNHQILMHRVIAGATKGDGMEVDHINRNRLDNRRENLRLIPRAANRQNVAGKPTGSSRHRGVSWDRGRNRWMAYVKVGGKMRHLGRFDNEEDAADVARRARAELLPYAMD